MGDRSAASNVTSRLKNIVNEAPFFCKVIELIICVVTVGLIVDPFNSRMQADPNHAAIVYVSLCGYILINAILILCYLIGERQPKRMSMVFSVTGAILCCAAGIVLIHDWSKLYGNMISQYYKQYSDQMAASGVFALLAALVFLIDAIVTNKYVA
ncbi:uncharacterized protein LOC105686564 [Athalia rosae]|uniref:uncharacterized protein LOC105686564 n=1 Tax=Athalia rosae TaxID=37344 RepID=UPI0006263B12|nr:uncharacterized protein LOC105686564 [Athalia rosae]